MFSTALIKMALLRFGVVVQAVSFDVDKKLIDVNYLFHGKKITKSIPFSQIEELFTSTTDGPAAYKRPYYTPQGPE